MRRSSLDRETGQITRIGDDMALRSQVRDTADGSYATRVVRHERAYALVAYRHR